MIIIADTIDSNCFLVNFEDLAVQGFHVIVNEFQVQLSFVRTAKNNVRIFRRGTTRRAEPPGDWPRESDGVGGSAISFRPFFLFQNIQNILCEFLRVRGQISNQPKRADCLFVGRILSATEFPFLTEPSTFLSASTEPRKSD